MEFQFNLDMELYLTKPDMTYKKVVLRDLLPMAFTPQSLKEERIWNYTESIKDKPILNKLYYDWLC